jgi:hypothetical protein
VSGSFFCSDNFNYVNKRVSDACFEAKTRFVTTLCLFFRIQYAFHTGTEIRLVNTILSDNTVFKRTVSCYHNHSTYIRLAMRLSRCSNLTKKVIQL